MKKNILTIISALLTVSMLLTSTVSADETVQAAEIPAPLPEALEASAETTEEPAETAQTAEEPATTEEDLLYTELSRENGRHIITVSGYLPAGVELNVAEISIGVAKKIVNENIEGTAGADISVVPTIFFAYDITLILGGEVFQPYEIGTSVRVSVSNIAEEIVSDELTVLHVIDEGSDTTVEQANITGATDSEIEFEAEHFSYFIGTSTSPINTFTAFKEAVAMANEYNGETTITVSGEITVTERLDISSDITLIAGGAAVISRGSNMTGASSQANSCIMVSSGATLHLGTVGGMGSGNTLTFDGSYSDGVTANNPMICVEGTMNMYDGVTVRNNCSYNANSHAQLGAINIRGEFFMYGGNVCDNFGYICGVYLVSASGAKMTMYGGSIRNNTASGAGAGIYSALSTTVSLYGGIISDNNCTSAIKSFGLTGGGGIHCNGSVILGGNIQIVNNIQNGGACNMLIKNSETVSNISYDSFAAGARIGISFGFSGSEKIVIANKLSGQSTDAEAAVFTFDSTGYTITSSNGKIRIISDSAASQVVFYQSDRTTAIPDKTLTVSAIGTTSVSMPDASGVTVPVGKQFLGWAKTDAENNITGLYAPSTLAGVSADDIFAAVVIDIPAVEYGSSVSGINTTGLVAHGTLSWSNGIASVGNVGTATAAADFTDAASGTLYSGFTVRYVVNQATNRWTSELVCNDVYTGTEVAACAEAAFGAVSYTYSTAGQAASAAAPTAAGTYTVTAYVAETSNYTGLSAQFEFEILEIPAAVVTASMLSFVPDETVYDGTEKTVEVTTEYELGTITVKYNGSAAAPTDAGTYVISVDITATQSYNATENLELGTFTIARKSVTVPILQKNIPYTGKPITAVITTGTPEAFIYEAEELSGTYVGFYSVSFSLTDNYIWSDGTLGSKSVIWSIRSSLEKVYYSSGYFYTELNETGTAVNPATLVSDKITTLTNIVPQLATGAQILMVTDYPLTLEEARKCAQKSITAAYLPTASHASLTAGVNGGTVNVTSSGTENAILVAELPAGAPTGTSVTVTDGNTTYAVSTRGKYAFINLGTGEAANGKAYTISLSGGIGGTVIVGICMTDNALYPSDGMSETVAVEIQAQTSSVSASTSHNRRIFEAGETVSFTVNYQISRGGNLNISYAEKINGHYTASAEVTNVILNAQSSDMTVTLTAPGTAGVYRYYFVLGESTAVFNIIVQ